MTVKSCRSAFMHEVLFYESNEEFLDGTVPLVRAGMEAGGCSLIAVGEDQTALLRAELGGEAENVAFLEMERVGRNPARIIDVWRDFLDRTASVSGPLLGIGEPVWPGRDATELDECRRHESLLNMAFDGTREWSLLCPYDSAALDDDVLEAARQSHPHVVSGGTVVESPGWRGSPSGYKPFSGKLPEPPRQARKLVFGKDELASVRRAIEAEADGALSGDQRFAMVIAVNELAANSTMHGGGSGTLHLWREPAALVAEVGDEGWIEEPLTGRLRPLPDQQRGRGLWMVNQLCDLVQIRSGPEGTRVRVRIRIGLE
ncbi:MAG TPA: sensor histidine kinase [Solirubrobacterales bacterium]|nr:sensor histidine kinase [Solirubrobacterales bacterium]